MAAISVSLVDTADVPWHHEFEQDGHITTHPSQFMQLFILWGSRNVGK